MSRNAASAVSERIDRVDGSRRPNIGLKVGPADDVYRLVKEPGDVILQPRVIENGDVRRGVEVDHDVDIAARAIVAARPRAEQRSVTDAPRPQRGFVFLEPSEDFRAVHGTSG